MKKKVTSQKEGYDIIKCVHCGELMRVWNTKIKYCPKCSTKNEGKNANTKQG